MAGLLLLAAYLLGSIPTALIITRWLGKVDIRTVGDGNMGAHNVHRILGWGPSILVAAVDFSKGALAVVLMNLFGFGLTWQLAALACAVLGHDFPIFAHFRGGQGLACTLGGLTALSFFEMLIGLTLYGLIYLITRNADLGAGIGTGLGVFLMAVLGQPILLVAGAVAIILTIPAKMILDRPRREEIHQSTSE
jgi:glycerol-3-phosphate acyltransferase PlsY